MIRKKADSLVGKPVNYPIDSDDSPYLGAEEIEEEIIKKAKSNKFKKTYKNRFDEEEMEWGKENIKGYWV